jgi:hypothetical protein
VGHQNEMCVGTCLDQVETITRAATAVIVSDDSHIRLHKDNRLEYLEGTMACIFGHVFTVA